MKRLSWLRLVFVAGILISLIGNFFSLGYILRNQREAPAFSLLADSPFAAYPEDVRAEFRSILRQNRARTASALDNLRAARRQLATVAGGSPINEAEVESAMRDVRAATDALQRLMQEFLLEALRAKHRASG